MADTQLPQLRLDMIEQFQCPGCMLGHRTHNCESFKYREYGNNGFGCINHVPGTMIAGIIAPGAKKTFVTVMLGMPRGFDRCGPIDFEKLGIFIRLFDTPDPSQHNWDKFNIPIWATEIDGYLFVRTYMPRNNTCYVDVIRGGIQEELVPDAVNVAEFAEEIN